MSAASDHLLAAQETQMQCIEKDSRLLQDHACYWGAVRREKLLLYAARTKGLKTIGCVPVPPCSVTAEQAKQAICMQLIVEELLHSPWAKEPWSLTDLSWERYQAAPKGCLKKGARVVEVEYDGNSSNKTWYTAWSTVYVRGTEEEGWETAVCAADGQGIYYCAGMSSKVYFETFETDARRWSRTGHWTVRDNDVIYHSTFGAPPHSRNDRDCIEGFWSDAGERRGSRGSDTTDRALPYPAARQSPICRPVRTGENRSRAVHRQAPYSAPSSPGSSVGPDSPSESSRQVPLVLLPGPSDPAPPSPDSTDVIAEGDKEPERFSILSKPGGQPCLILSGNGNQAKCYRFRCKRYFREHYQHITTTWWTVGERGSERHGDACVLVTFKDSSQRGVFLKRVPLPPGMRAQALTMIADF